MVATMGRAIQLRLHDLISELSAISASSQGDGEVRRVQLALAMLHAAADELDLVDFRATYEKGAVALPHG
jgi:hypothetical protein